MKTEPNTKSHKEHKSSKKKTVMPAFGESTFIDDLDSGSPDVFTKSIAVEIRNIEDDGMTMEFDVVGVLASVSNALRRALLVEVPSMAPETIMLQQNVSVMADEILGHRIGLIPFKADARKFKFRPPKKNIDHPDYALLFELKVTAPKQNLKTDKRFTNTRVYSSDFRFTRHQAHPPDMTDSALRPVSEKILVNILRPSQEMDLVIHVVKGIGKDHIKFSPVSLATYKLIPVIELLQPVKGNDAVRLQKCFSPGVISVEEDIDGILVAKVVNPRLDTGSRNILREPDLKNVVELGTKKDHFLFSVESIGALDVATLVREACLLLKARCEYHVLSIGTQHSVSTSD